jgi:hypothetical protein
VYKRQIFVTPASAARVVSASTGVLPAPGIQQLIMAVQFMVKDEQHKKYLLYPLDTNESTQTVGIPIRVQGFLKAASYLCDASLYEYLKAIYEKE